MKASLILSVVLLIAAAVLGWLFMDTRNQLSERELALLTTQQELQTLRTQHAETETARQSAEKEMEKLDAAAGDAKAQATLANQRAQLAQNEIRKLKQQLTDAQESQQVAQDEVQRLQREIIQLRTDPARMSAAPEPLSSGPSEASKSSAPAAESPYPQPLAPATQPMTEQAMSAPLPHQSVGLQARIISISPSRDVLAVDKGSRSGLATGQRHDLYLSGQFIAALQLTRVDDTFAIGQLQDSTPRLKELDKGISINMVSQR